MDRKIISFHIDCAAFYNIQKKVTHLIDLHVIKNFPIFFYRKIRHLDKQQQVLLTHGDSITKCGDRLKLCALSTSQVIAGIWNEEARVFGVQFHPEVKLNSYRNSNLRLKKKSVNFMRLPYRLT